MFSLLFNIDPKINYSERLLSDFTTPPKLHNVWNNVVYGKYTNTRYQTKICSHDLELAHEKFNPMILDSANETFFEACLDDVLRAIYQFWDLKLNNEAKEFIEKVKQHWQKVNASTYPKRIYKKIISFLQLIPEDTKPEDLCKRIEVLLFPDFIDYSNSVPEKIILYTDLMTQYQIINYTKFNSSLIFPQWIIQDSCCSHYAIVGFFQTLSVNKIRFYRPIPIELQKIIDNTIANNDTKNVSLTLIELIRYYEFDILKFFPKILSHPLFISSWCNSTQNPLPPSIMQSSLLHENAVMDYIMCCSDEGSVRQFITLHQTDINTTITNKDKRTPCMQFIIKFGTPPPEPLWHDPNIKDSDGKTVTDHWVAHIDRDGNNIPAALRAKHYTDAKIGCEHACDADEAYMLDNKLYCKNCCNAEKAKRVFNSLQECFICANEYPSDATYAIFNECHHVSCKACANRSIYCPFCRSGNH